MTKIKHILVMAFFKCHTIFVICQLPYNDLIALCALFVPFWKRGTTVLFQRFGLKNHFRGSEVFAGASVFQNSCSYASRLLSRSLICESCLCFSCKSSQNLTFMDKRRDKPHSKVDIDMNPRLSSSGNKGSGGGNVGKSREEGRQLKGEV